LINIKLQWELRHCPKWCTWRGPVISWPSLAQVCVSMIQYGFQECL